MLCCDAMKSSLDRIIAGGEEDDMLDERCVLDLEYDRIDVRAITGRQFDWI